MAASIMSGEAAAAGQPYCGDQPMTLGRLFARDPAGGIPALFEGRRVSWSFNTRVAIRQACDALGLAPGDEVLAPAYNCGSELDPLLHAGLRVTLYPVDRRTGIEPDDVARRVTARTRAVYLTHYFGVLQPATAALRALCDERGLLLIEDCALSLLSGDPVEGRAGDAAVFCFYKFFPVLAGGALVLNTARAVAEPRFDGRVPGAMVARQVLRAGLSGALGGDRARALRARIGRGGGARVPAPPPEDGLPDMPAHYYFDPRLRDARISRFAARPLRAFDVSGAIAARKANHAAWLEALDGMPGATPLFPDLPGTACPLSMPVLVADRDAVAAGLAARGIPATPWWAGYDRHLDWDGFDDARHLKNHVLSLPAHQFLGAEHVTHMAAELRAALREAG